MLNVAKCTKENDERNILFYYMKISLFVSRETRSSARTWYTHQAGDSQPKSATRRRLRADVPINLNFMFHVKQTKEFLLPFPVNF